MKDRKLPPEQVLTEFEAQITETVRPEDAETHLDLAVAYGEMGLDVQAHREVALALQHASSLGIRSLVEAHLLLGKLCERGGDLAQAFAAYQRALAIDPLNGTAAAGVHRLGFVLLA